jgi:hypothetical protein
MHTGTQSTISDRRWFGLIGILPLTTALIDWRPVHTRFGISPCKIAAAIEATLDTKTVPSHWLVNHTSCRTTSHN